jgi:benzoyl-CoA reductase/2-hydroxyglutaryl-CoA dehydratase subunit BcrC/BadD/HgdB
MGLPDDQDVIRTVTRGFENLDKQIRDRDDKVSSLSEKMVGVELKLDQLKETLANKNETEKLAMRVGTLEETNKELKTKQADNAKWIKGLATSVVLLLLAIIFNAIRIGFK